MHMDWEPLTTTTRKTASIEGAVFIFFAHDNPNYATNDECHDHKGNGHHTTTLQMAHNNTNAAHICNLVRSVIIFEG